MTYSRLLTIGGVVLAGASVALSQTPPAPPAPTAPPAMAAPAPARAPVATPAPSAPWPAPAAAAPRAFELLGDLDNVITPEIQDRLDEVRDRIRDMHLDLDIDVQAQVEAAREAIRAVEPQIAYATGVARGLGRGVGVGVGGGFAFAPQITPTAPMPPTPPAARAMQVFRMSGDRAYSAGQSALDSRHWDDAVNYFSQVINRGTTRVDGALYWKAYALAKLGRRDDSLAAIAELRKSYPSSKWLDEAKALEIEVNQGIKPMSPEEESDEGLKILILQQGFQSDFDRFFPALEKILRASTSSPKLRSNALYVLAGSSSPKAQALIEQIARGGGNPDLQVKAIRYMTERRRGNTGNPNSGQILTEIYGSTTDIEVKRAVLEALVSAKDKDRLLALLKNEKNTDLRQIGIGYLGEIPGNAELWQLYQTETSPDVKIMLLNHAHRNGNPDKLLEVVRTEKEPKIRIAAVRAYGSYGTGGEALVSIYSTEQDLQVKQAIIDQISSQRNGKLMVDLAKAEKDPKLKMRLFERLSNMKNCKECSDYMLEILNK